MTVYRTRNSVYEVDEAGKRARQVEGPDESMREWRAFDNALLLPILPGRDKNALGIYWAADDDSPWRQEVTVTSAVQSVEPALPLEV